MKVLIVTDAYYPYPSGVTEYSANIAKALRETGIKTDVLTLHYDDEKDEYNLIRVGYCKLFNLNKQRVTLPWSLKISEEVKRVINEGHYDIIHLNGPFCPNISYLALKYSNTANIATFHSAPLSIPRFTSLLHRMLFRSLIKKLDVRIGVSQVAVNFIKPYFPGEYSVIPCGVDTTIFNNNVSNFKDMNNYGDALKILFVGRLDKKKGLDILIKALSRLDGDIHYHLYIAGDSISRNKYQTMAIELNVPTTFLGYLYKGHGLENAYANADIYCAPTRGRETFGIVLIESMACGTPVIASDVDGYNLVIEDGENGILVESNPESFKKGIEKLARDKKLCNRLKRNGLEFARKHNWKNITKDLIMHYEKAIDISKKRLGNGKTQ
ncbi:glycosyltransferase family 4 protein [candidate division WOR-3 bacterium]|jgi:phosphatidylinositol alpha-mannosyltransferase|nr:glycosyltransferase family 4 protein [candidate division WOR-3 bacterium]